MFEANSDTTNKMYLSLLEQSPRSRTIYTQLCFCFMTAGQTSQEAVADTLSDGLKRLTASFPWLAGQVICVESENYEPYAIRVEYLAEIPQLTVRDYTADKTIPGMKDMIEARFPYSMLDEKLFCSRSTLSEWSGEDQVYPVLLLQASFISGGFLLTLQACHSVMDIVGEAQIIRMLSKACHDEELTTQAVTGGNLDRRDVVPLLQNFEHKEEPGSNESKYTKPLNSMKEAHVSPPQMLVWGYIAFSAESLTSLKATAQTELPVGTTFVSTDDCISALIWQSIARSRSSRLNPNVPLTFVRQVDARRYMDVSDTYLGNMVSQTTSTQSVQELCDGGLGMLALMLRRELNPEALRYRVREQATNQATGIKQSGGAKERVNTITMSSWSKVDLHDLDFNIGFGKPVAIRRPQFTPIEGIVYLLPRAADEEILAGLCLRSEDMACLRKDTKFSRYAEYVG